ncbi:hypothetical protein [Thermanaeromonas toyohensis]|nr:hypothetical protein [Thermanaeromonas toyohensis]
MVKKLADEIAKITRLLPGWEVVHSGGGIIMAVRDFELSCDGQKCLAGVSVDDDAAVAYRAGSTWLRAGDIIPSLGCLGEDVDEVVLVASNGKRRQYPGADLLSFGDVLEIEKAMDVLGGVSFNGAKLETRCPACGVEGVRVLLVDGYLEGYNGNVYFCCPGEGRSVPLFDAGLDVRVPGRCGSCGHQGNIGDFVIIVREREREEETA